MELLRVTSTFENGNKIPEKYGYHQENISPYILIEKIPLAAKTLVVIIDDPDASNGVWTHWVVFDIPLKNSEKFEIKENSVPGTLGMNDFKQTEYGGPCPPAGTHRYHFRVYALDAQLGLDEGVTRDEIERRIQEQVIAKGEIMGKFEKL
jgi:Raf kinase inhibitor-like YbhB/YbcL family protein